MNFRKKEIEEQYNSEDEQYEDQKINDGNDSKKEDDKRFLCKCGKSYPLQSSLFNHIKIKHGDDKNNFQVPRGVKPGRPRIADNSEKSQSKKKKNEKKPEDLDEGTWFHLMLYKNKLFQNLIISFKDYITKLFENEQDKEDKIWKEYEIKRDNLFQKLNFPEDDRKETKKQTDYLLKKLGMILDPKYTVQIFFNFLKAYINTYFTLPDQKTQMLLQHTNTEEQKMYERCNEILKLEYKSEIQEIQEGEKKENSQDNLENQENQKNDYQEVSQSELDPKFDDKQNEGYQYDDEYQQQQQQQQQQQIQQQYQQQQLQQNNSLQQNPQTTYYDQNYRGQQNQNNNNDSNHFNGNTDNNENIDNNNNNDNNNDDFDPEALDKEAYADAGNNQFLNENFGQPLVVPKSFMNIMSYRMTSYQNINNLNQQASNLKDERVQNGQYLLNFLSYQQNNQNEEYESDEMQYFPNENENEAFQSFNNFVQND